MRYQMIIHWSKDDDSFVVEVPELPGCMADGQTYAEAVANAEKSSTNGLKPPANSAARFPNPAESWPMPERPLTLFWLRRHYA